MAGLIFASCSNGGESIRIQNPYEGVNWNQTHHLHGGSHMHARSEPQWEMLHEMGIRHFSLSNYYPSAPIWPLPDDFIENNPGIITAPNAEHHGSTDHDLHFTTPGSFYTTGYGRGFSSEFDVDWDITPFVYRFSDLNRFSPDAEIPGEGVYRLDLRRDAGSVYSDGEAAIKVTLRGARVCDHSTFETIGDGLLVERQYFGYGSDSLYFCVEEDEVELEIAFDPVTTRIDRVRVMQGTNRPWRDAFREALDGNRADPSGRPMAGLQYPDGGGIIINHPRHPAEESIEMLNFDDRVLGVEVWNHRRWFGLEDEEPHLSYYHHWDEILRRGSRAFGFFVKDHRLTGRGRNVLLVPDPAGRTMDQRQRDALRAYREGQFYGLLGAWDNVDSAGNVRPPYDFSEFSFRNIELILSEVGRPVELVAEVGGHDPARRPNIQVRFVTDRGVEEIVNGQSVARFGLPVTDDGSLKIRYVRIEAFAYPETYRNGEELNAETFEMMNVYEVARIHDRTGSAGSNDVDPPGTEPIGTVDMMFSQPIRFISDR